MQAKPQAPRQEIADVCLPILEMLFIIRKKHEIVHVPQVWDTFQLFFNEQVKLVQVDIRPEL